MKVKIEDPNDIGLINLISRYDFDEPFDYAGEVRKGAKKVKSMLEILRLAKRCQLCRNAKYQRDDPWESTFF